MIFYFTGTGNCLYVAKKMETHPISIPQIINHPSLNFKDEKIGIVAPIYGHEMPEMVKDFIKKATFETDYFYLILTYGNRHGGAAKLAWQFMQENNKKVNYINVLKMVDNYLPGFDMAEQKSIDKQVDFHLNKIIGDVNNHLDMIAPVSKEDLQAHQQYLQNRAKMGDDIYKNLYRVTDKCIKCQICTKVCPGHCISFKNDQITFNSDNCQMCMACIHNCLTKAIQLNIPEKNCNERYRHKDITLNEIFEANNQN